ncbi:hypothetical protein ACIQPQ_34715 [Streptomyces sp. NPDC091281]|uniref:hypothetical protein n=1 Tax=Streptomyces sp. NPDC091281 TaxID=3365985 RepID=UPI0038306C41
MRYATISVTGDLIHHDGTLDWDRLIGPEGKARVHLPGLAAAGWVNDVGLRLPEKYPLNEVGSCVLAALGANIQPYNGQIVLTGWNPENTRLGLLEIAPLPEPVDVLDTVHGDVIKAIAGHTPRALSPSWGEQIREIAAHIRTMPTPGLTIRTVKLS